MKKCYILLRNVFDLVMEEAMEGMILGPVWQNTPPSIIDKLSD